MQRRQKQVRGNQVSFWLGEEGCGVAFSVSEESEDEYFLMQRHFEEPDDGRRSEVAREEWSYSTEVFRVAS